MIITFLTVKKTKQNKTKQKLVSRQNYSMPPSLVSVICITYLIVIVIGIAFHAVKSLNKIKYLTEQALV